MTSYKIYRAGNHIEIYEYESTNIPDNVEFEGYDLEKVSLDRGDRKEERRKQTLRDNANKLRRMARAYFADCDVYFVTLTFADLMTDIDKADRRVKYFFKKLRNAYGDISYLGVRELQKRGAIHYHFLVKDNTGYLNKELKDLPYPQRVGNRTIKSDKQKEWEVFVHDKFWRYGFVDWTRVSFVDDFGAYLIKYMTKGDVKNQEWQEFRRLVLRSKDIKTIEPVDARLEENREFCLSIIQNIDFYTSVAQNEIKDNCKRRAVFTSGYESKYTGKVTYFDINLERLSKIEENID